MTQNSNSRSLFRPLFAAGIIISVFGVLCLISSIYVGLQEESEGFKIIGWRFIAGGIISISLGIMWRYRDYIRFLLKRSKYQHLYKP